MMVSIFLNCQKVFQNVQKHLPCVTLFFLMRPFHEDVLAELRPFIFLPIFVIQYMSKFFFPILHFLHCLSRAQTYQYAYPGNTLHFFTPPLCLLPDFFSQTNLQIFPSVFLFILSSQVDTKRKHQWGQQVHASFLQIHHIACLASFNVTCSLCRSISKAV